MSRAHVEFIQSQTLPWQKGLHGEGRDDVDSKILSIDNGTGACTAVVRYPPGWANPSSDPATPLLLAKSGLRGALRLHPESGHYGRQTVRSANDAVDGSPPPASRCAKVWLV
jgi:hypothetical protein